jgi:hypothetical protein
MIAASNASTRALANSFTSPEEELFGLKMVEEECRTEKKNSRPIGHPKFTFKSVDSDQFQIGPRIV